mmetsp:Transcript_24277/g.34060  ORF Transcript_24277/g.34060 Transcript_24277/m.34060 type:complete len:81 (-) Transcript_24277:712-954(-)
MPTIANVEGKKKHKSGLVVISWAPFFCVDRGISSLQVCLVHHIVLHHEDHIKEHRHKAQSKLDRVASHTAPVTLSPAIKD